MNKSIILLLIICCSLTSFSQVQRKSTPSSNSPVADSSITNNERKDKRSANKEIMEKLDLSKDQKLAIKGIMQTAKDKINAIRDNAGLSEEEKKFQIRQVKKDAANQIQVLVLTPEQKRKYLEMKQDDGTDG